MGGIGNPTGKSRGKIKSCEDLVINTQLSSPKPEVLAKIEKGDILELSLASPVGPCLVFYKDLEAGSIITIDLKRIIECMNEGHDYVAIVRGVDGGKCSLTIKHVDA